MANLDPVYVKNLPLIGKTMTEAETYLNSLGFILRVVEKDKQSLMVNANKVVENRINVAVHGEKLIIYKTYGAY